MVNFKYKSSQWGNVRRMKAMPRLSFRENRNSISTKFWKQYIEKVIPHISSLLVASISDLIDRSEVIVIGKKSPEVQQTIARLRGDKTVIDLVRLFPDLESRPTNYEGIAW